MSLPILLAVDEDQAALRELESQPRDARGFVLTGANTLEAWSEERQPLPLETSMPGVFAAGEVRHGSSSEWRPR